MNTRREMTEQKNRTLLNMHTHIHTSLDRTNPNYNIRKYVLQTHIHMYTNVYIHALTRMRMHAHMLVHTMVGIHAPTETKKQVK